MSYIIIQGLDFNGEEVRHEIVLSKEEAMKRGRDMTNGDPSKNIVIFKDQGSKEITIFYKKETPKPKL